MRERVATEYHPLSGSGKNTYKVYGTPGSANYYGQRQYKPQMGSPITPNMMKNLSKPLSAAIPKQIISERGSERQSYPLVGKFGE
jgi:hypothetical protein